MKHNALLAGNLIGGLMLPPELRHPVNVPEFIQRQNVVVPVAQLVPVPYFSVGMASAVAVATTELVTSMWDTYKDRPAPGTALISVKVVAVESVLTYHALG